MFHRLTDHKGWEQVFTSPFLDETVEHLALNTRVTGHWGDKLVAASSGTLLLCAYPISKTF